MSAAEAVSWHWEPAAVLPIAAVSLAYSVGMLRLWRSAGIGRGVSAARAAAFAGGMLLLVTALCSPLAGLAEQLFSAHMVVHEVVMAAAAPLLVAARPMGPLAWALPRSFMRVLKPVRFFSVPLVATLLQAAVIWLWHVPWAFRAASESAMLHDVQHASFLAAALLFWQAMEQAARDRAGVAVGYLFATSLHTGFLGALLMLSPRLWFPAHGGFGLSPLEDQQLAGAIMWMPGGMIYAILALAYAGRWIGGRADSAIYFASGWQEKN